MTAPLLTVVLSALLVRFATSVLRLVTFLAIARLTLRPVLLPLLLSPLSMLPPRLSRLMRLLLPLLLLLLLCLLSRLMVMRLPLHLRLLLPLSHRE